MKAAYFLVGAILSAVAVAIPNQDEKQPQDSTCKLASYIPDENFSMPEIDIEGDSAVSIEDPLPIQNTSVSLNERILKGNYSLLNGVVEGLSSMTHDFGYNPINQRITLNATLKYVHLTGIYEIIDGQANLTTLGEHTFLGSGPLNASATGVVAALGFTLIVNPVTQYVSIGSFKIDFAFDSAYITAENLVVDGEPVDWEKFNQNIKQMYEEIWLGAYDVNVQLIQNEINRLLEGCTLMDLIQLVKPPQRDEQDDQN